MRFASLGSGSSGNATLVQAGDQLVMVDCGYSLKETRSRLARLDCNIEDLTALLVTHEHGDHMGGVDVLARRLGIPVYLTAGTLKAKPLRQEVRVEVINSHRSFQIGDLQVQPVAVPHDAVEPVQYVFHCGALRLGILTDLGHITPYVVEAYQRCDGLLLEANHDVQMLAGGPYPPSLKRRVGGAWGHLNNHQSADLLAQIETKRIQHLVLGHISLQNNALDKVKQAVCPATEAVNAVHYACQEQGFNWISLA